MGFRAYVGFWFHCSPNPEYVEHFCGLECYQRFEARAKTGNETDADPNACDSLPSD
ncbi:DUF3330 domain-containing protein [Pseudomonas aeruginosa]